MAVMEKSIETQEWTQYSCWHGGLNIIINRFSDDRDDEMIVWDYKETPVKMVLEQKLRRPFVGELEYHYGK